MDMTATGANLAANLISILRAHEAELRAAGVRHLSLFGSVARGDAVLASDVDLSDVDLAAELDPGARIGLFRLMALERRLGDLLGLPVDLVPEPVEKHRLQAHIDRDGQRAF